MKSVRAQLLIVCLLGLGLAACQTTDEERVVEACRSICGCMAGPLPALQDRCVTDCRRNISPSQVGDECLDCLSANADRCVQIENECEPICEPPNPVDDGSGGGPL